MKVRGTIALSSLAVSVSAAALLGVSGVAMSDEEEPFCHYGNSCSLYGTEGGPAVGYCMFNQETVPVCGCEGQAEIYVWDPWQGMWQFLGWDTIFQAYNPDCWYSENI
jgi:hypothetical protein